MITNKSRVRQKGNMDNVMVITCGNFIQLSISRLLVFANNSVSRCPCLTRSDLAGTHKHEFLSLITGTRKKEEVEKIGQKVGIT